MSYRNASPNLDRERDKADAFMNELLGYLLLNTNIPRFESPI